MTVLAPDPSASRPANEQRPIPFLDLGSMHDEVRADLDAVHRRTVDRGQFVGGPNVAEFETRWAEYCNVQHAVGVANGTDALELVLRALGIGPGDEVIVPANTFIATAEAVVAVGAFPKFVDIDSGTLLMRPEIVEATIGPRTAAIIAVHLYGEVAPMTELATIADKAGLLLVEDAAQAHGATWDGSRAGSIGRAGCFSFYPGKNLGALGDGGAVVTDDQQLAARVRSLGNHGRSERSRHHHDLIGRNSRLDELQAGYLNAKLGRLDRWNAQRRAAAATYEQHLRAMPWIRTLERDPRSHGVHHVFAVEVDDRDQVQAALEQRGIGTGIHYPVPCHRQPSLARHHHDPCRVAERSAGRLLSLPLSPGLTEFDIERVCRELKQATIAAGRRGGQRR